MQGTPKIVYIKPHVGCEPNLTWRAAQDPNIHSKLQVVHDIDLLRDVEQHRRIWLGPVHSSDDISAVPRQGFSRCICYIGEPHRDLGNHWQNLDRPYTEIVMTGSANFQLQHARVYRIETFFGEMVKLYRNLQQDIVPRPIKAKPYYFDALLGTAIRLPRAKIAQHLESKHAGKNLVKLYPFKTPYLFRDVIADHYVWPDGVDITGLENEQFYAAQMVKYKGFPAMVCLIIPWNVYDKTAYSIVAETLVDNAFNFYTEKTAKPIMARRLFVAFAGQYHLRNLRAIGFKTFDGIIDESYDLESDSDRRWQMALEQVDRLCRMDQLQVLRAIEPIAEHNFHTLMSRDWAHEANELLIDLMLAEN